MDIIKGEMLHLDYPWYHIVSGDEIQQGDILDNCPVFILPPALSIEESSATSQPYEIPFEGRDVIVMSQTCDMEKGREKISEILFCCMWKRSDFKSDQSMSMLENWENARKGS